MPLLRATRRAAPSIARAAASRSYRPVGAALRHCSTTAAIDEDLYHSLASCTLETIQEVYDDEADDNAQLNMEVEYSDGVLNVIVGDKGTFVLNKQAPNLQIWLSSPISGPLRYDFCRESVAWRNSRDQHDLLSLLGDDFETLVGKRLDFGRVGEALADEADGRL